jgi:hypothetical protein
VDVVIVIERDFLDDVLDALGRLDGGIDLVDLLGEVVVPRRLSEGERLAEEPLVAAEPGEDLLARLREEVLVLVPDRVDQPDLEV